MCRVYYVCLRPDHRAEVQLELQRIEFNMTSQALEMLLDVGAALAQLQPDNRCNTQLHARG